MVSHCNDMKASLTGNIIRILIIFIALAGAGTGMALHSLTLVSIWIVVSGALAIAVPIAIALSGKDLRCISCQSRLLRFALWLTATAPTLVGVYYAVNYAGADGSKATAAAATLERKYYTDRQRTHRVGCRYVASGETYRTYYADMRLEESGYIVKISLTARQAGAHRPGECLQVKVAPGMLGAPVVLRKSILNQ